MSLFEARKLLALAVLAAPACVVRLTDRNSALPNGGVTGAPADCAKVQPVARAAVGAAPEVRFVGRYDFTDPDKPRFDWSGNYISARFTGTEVTAGLRTLDGNDLFFQVVVDDREPVKIRVTLDREGYTLAEGLDPNKPHEVILHRNTEAQKGIVEFTGFDFGPGGKLLPPTVRQRRIEIIGDSITCGYGNEGENATCPFDVEIRPGVRVPFTENQYLSYGAIAGRALDADVTTICWSGKGVYINYKENPGDKDRLVTVPELWKERTVGNAGPTSNPPGPAWDFSKEKPDEKPQAVVINLGTNDFARDNEPPPKDPTKDLPGDNVPDGTIDRARFRDAMRDLVLEVRRHRPDAEIFLAVPPMLTDQFPLDNARSDHRAALMGVMEELQGKGDKRVHVIELVEQGVRYGLGCDYHPNLEVHRIMADQVAGAIRTKLCW